MNKKKLEKIQRLHVQAADLSKLCGDLAAEAINSRGHEDRLWNELCAAYHVVEQRAADLNLEYNP